MPQHCYDLMQMYLAGLASLAGLAGLARQAGPELGTSQPQLVLSIHWNTFNIKEIQSQE